MNLKDSKKLKGYLANRLELRLLDKALKKLTSPPPTFLMWLVAPDAYHLAKQGVEVKAGGHILKKTL